MSFMAVDEHLGMPLMHPKVRIDLSNIAGNTSPDCIWILAGVRDVEKKQDDGRKGMVQKKGVRNS